MNVRFSEDREEGFSLNELLLVIAISGILGAIAIGAFLNQRAKAKDNILRSNMTQAVNKIENALVTAPAAQSMKQVGAKTGQGQTGEFVLEIDGSSNQIKIPLDDGVTIIVASGSKASKYVLNGYVQGGSKYSSRTSLLTYDSKSGGFLS